MKAKRVIVLAIGAVILVLGAAAVGMWGSGWAYQNRGISPTGYPRILLVDPGTEILFALKEPVDLATRMPTPSFPPEWEVQFVPEPRPGTGKCWGGGRWFGMGVVWASRTHILYVAPDAPGILDIVELLPPDRNLGTSVRTGARILIATKGDPRYDSLGLTADQAGKDPWWGTGSARVRIAKMRSRAEVGEDRILPPKAYMLRETTESLEALEELKLYDTSYEEYAKQPYEMKVAPGTEIVFGLSRSVNPQPSMSRAALKDWDPEFEAQLRRWTKQYGAWRPGAESGDGGVVQASERQIVYRAPSQPGTIQTLALDYPGEQFDLTIVTLGGNQPHLDAMGVPLAEKDDRWWGRGTFRLKVLSAKAPR